MQFFTAVLSLRPQPSPQLLWIEGCRVASAADPARSLISVSYTVAAIFLSSSSSFIVTRAEWTPSQTHCYEENLAASGNEPGTSGLAGRNCDHLTTEAVPIHTR
jgi:hypothetical protein